MGSAAKPACLNQPRYHTGCAGTQAVTLAESNGEGFVLQGMTPGSILG